jgi:hypothetical protein
MEKLKSIFSDPDLMAKAAAEEAVKELNEVLTPVIRELDKIIETVNLSRFWLLQVGAIAVFERALAEIKKRVAKLEAAGFNDGGHSVQ